MMLDRVGVVVIGRNEGERLKRCLRSLPRDVATVYVDSGSTDGSVEFARSLGVMTVDLDTSMGFTAARARNAGWRALAAAGTSPRFIQFVDGDCEMAPGWLECAEAALGADSQLAAVFGRLRERYPERSLYNRLCDEEWNVPPGEVNACGGIAMLRTEALAQAGGYSEDLIAGEEPDLCLRMRNRGWRVHCIAEEMAWHDANMLSFGAWWKRTRRSGYAYCAHVLRHGKASDPVWRRQVVSIAFWGFGWPLATILTAALVSRVSLVGALGILALLALSYLLQLGRIATRRYRSGTVARTATFYAILIIIGKFVEMGGVLRCLRDRLARRTGTLIEHK